MGNAIEDIVILEPRSSIDPNKDLSPDQKEARWKYIAGPESLILTFYKDKKTKKARDLKISDIFDFKHESYMDSRIENQGSQQAYLLKYKRAKISERFDCFTDRMLKHPVRIFGYLLIGTGYLFGVSFFLLILIAISKTFWETGRLLYSSITYQKILEDPGATATFAGVLLTGLFGFSGIILSNWLNARSAREQSIENEKLLRIHQKEIATGIDNRIHEFAKAFDRYHSETLKAFTKK